MKKLLLVAVLWFLVPTFAWAQNIVIVVLDDWGVERTGVYSAAYGWATAGATPTIDALATAGVRFDRFAAEPWCSPMRTSMLTGRHPFRHGVGTALELQTGLDNDRNNGLNANEQNIVKLLRQAGYRTEHYGKYHVVGANEGSAINTHPLRTGFQTYKGNLGNINQSTTGAPITKNYLSYEWCEGSGGPRGTATCATNTEYHTTNTTDEAVAAVSGTAPFFLWVGYNAPHLPSHCPPNDLHTMTDDCPGFTVNQFHQAAAEAVDTELARLVSAINTGPGWATTTMIVVGDNGTFATAITAPFNSAHSKQTVYQSGVRTPLIVRGQAVTGSEAGTVGQQSIHTPDIAATILDIAGLDTKIADGTAEVTDGISIQPYLTESSTTSIRTVTFQQAFEPTGLPYTPNVAMQHERSTEHGAYRLLRFEAGNEEMYESMVPSPAVDYHEAAPLNLGTLTHAQQNAYNLMVNMHDDTGGTPIPMGRSIADAP